jgi:hypothetical protein
MHHTRAPLRRAGLAAILLTLGGAASAEDGINTTVSGFGTVAGSFTNNENLQYRHDSTEFTGASNAFDVGTESRLGLQVVVDFGQALSFTGQEVVKKRQADSFSPGTEWLFMQYSPTPDLLLHLGRVAIDTFLLSDSINVGYASIWLRAPNEVYASEPFKYVDGVQAIWRKSLGPINVKLEAESGAASVDLEIGGVKITQSAKWAYNTSATLEYESFLVNFAKTNVDAPLTLPIGPHGLTYETRDDFIALGAQYDDGRAIVLTEWTKRTQNDIPIVKKPLAASSQWYVAAGWHFGSLTPMATYGEYLPKIQLIAPSGSYHTWSGALRYDVMRNVALKAEVSSVQAANARYFVTPIAHSDEHTTVASIGADFVF